MNSYPASIIAAFFVDKAIKEGKPITQMKLQKMVYFAQGVSLALYDDSLIKEEIQAWKFGPVVPIIYDYYKFYGNLPITNTNKVLDFPTGNELKNRLEKDAIEVLNYTWDATKNHSATSLSNWTHEMGSPWQQVYSDGDWATPISNDSIKRYFIEFLIDETQA